MKFHSLAQYVTAWGDLIFNWKVLQHFMWHKENSSSSSTEESDYMIKPCPAHRLKSCYKAGFCPGPDICEQSCIGPVFGQKNLNVQSCKIQNKVYNYQFEGDWLKFTIGIIIQLPGLCYTIQMQFTWVELVKNYIVIAISTFILHLWEEINMKTHIC